MWWGRGVAIVPSLIPLHHSFFLNFLLLVAFSTIPSMRARHPPGLLHVFGSISCPALRLSQKHGETDVQNTQRKPVLPTGTHSTKKWEKKAGVVFGKKALRGT